MYVCKIMMYNVRHMQLYYYILYVYVQIIWPVHNVLDVSLHVLIHVHKQKSLNINSSLWCPYMQ